MYYIHHIHNATASSQSLVLPNFFPNGPCVCIVKHTSLSFLSLSDSQSESPLKEILSIQINGRILCVNRIPSSKTQSVSGSNLDRLSILTDHHQPRLFVLRFNDKSNSNGVSQGLTLDQTSILTEESLLLEEFGRPPAESGLTVEVEEGVGAKYMYSHTHAGILKVAKLYDESEIFPSKAKFSSDEINSKEKGPDLSHAFTVRLPHPHLISSSFLSRRESSRSQSQIALLSLSSTASRLPGLGMQCLPVLSFHTIDESNQELAPLPWGPPRKLPAFPATQESTENEKTERRRSSQSKGEGSSSNPKTTKSKRNGPAAVGATRTEEEEVAYEEQLAKAPVTRAHVPLPFSDALGAHLILPLPSRAGGGILVFSETSVLLVPPPSVNTDKSTSMLSPKSPSATDVVGKRRKSGSGEVTTSSPRRPSVSSSQSTTADVSMSVSPTTTTNTTARSNENGKRRRSTAGSNSAIAITSPTLKAVEQTTPARRRSSAASNSVSHRILRSDLPVPVIVASAIVVKEPLVEGDDGIRIQGEETKAFVNVLFATHSGKLELLKIGLQKPISTGKTNEEYHPISMSVQSLGATSAPGGPNALTYLGENFVHISSTTGDSALIQINRNIEEDSVNDKMSIVNKWPNLAPILDFVIDDGAGGDPSAAVSAQARIITCSGSGPTGSLRMIRNGVGLEEFANIELSGVRRIWNLNSSSSHSTAFLLLSLQKSSKLLSLTSSGFEDRTDLLLAAGVDINLAIMDAVNLDQGFFAIVNSTGVSLLQSRNTQAVSHWRPSEEVKLSIGAEPITRAAMNEKGQILVAFKTGNLSLLKVTTTGIDYVTSIKLPSEVSALDITSTITNAESNEGLAIVALWKPSIVKILGLPDLNDQTPNILATPQPSLIRSVKLHSFSVNGNITSTPFLMIGLGNGTLTSYGLSLPTKESITQSIGVLERRSASLGTQPLHLRSFHTVHGLHAIFAACDRSSVLFSQGKGITYSSIRHQDVLDVCQLDFPVYDCEQGQIDRLMVFVTPERMFIAKMGEISKIDISTVELGYDNPMAIASCPEQKVLGVVTTRFLSQGRGSDPIAGGKVLIRDSEHLESLDEYELEMEERPNCIDSFSREGIQYFVIGTGYTYPDRKETVSGRILLLQIDQESKKVELVCSKNVEGNVFDVKAVNGKHIIACVNAKVISYEIVDGDTDMNEGNIYNKDTLSNSISLWQTGLWACAFTATTLSITNANKIVVGDALRSIVILKMDEKSGKLMELARDCDPYWTISCACIDEDEEVYVGSDIGFNLWTCKRLKWTKSAKDRLEQARLRESEVGGNSSGGGRRRGNNDQNENEIDLVDETWSHIMQRDGGFHYGDLINKMKKGSLISASNNNQATDESSIQSKIIFGTAAGAIGILAKLDERSGRILSQLELKIQDSIESVGKIPVENYRTLRTDHRVQPSAGFIDGFGLCNAFDPLTNQERISLINSGRLPIDAGIDEINNLVESLHRLS